VTARMSSKLDADVVVVGFGPVGAALAGLLGLRGVRVVAIDRDVDVFPLPRAAHVDHQALRILQELGCVDEVLVNMLPNPGLDFVTAEHDLLLRIPGDQRSISGLPASMYFHQPRFDRTIRRVVTAMPSVHVRLGTELTSLRVEAELIAVGVRDAHGAEGELTARWLVGCDGASSSVRELAGIGLADLQFDEDWLVVDLLLKNPVSSLPDHALTVCDPNRPYTAIPIPEGRFRFEFMLLAGEDASVMQQPTVVNRLLAPWLPADDIKVERSAVYTFHGLIARPWRKGRVLVAGDAAHQMPPFLGQGLCSGLRDAANLAWKLDRVVRNRAPETLLNTYEVERAPHVGTIISAAIDFGRMTCELDPEKAADSHRRIRAESMRTNASVAFGLPSLTSGPLVLGGGGELFVQPVAPPGSRLDDRIGGRFLIIGKTRKGLGETGSWWSEEIGAYVTLLDQLPDADGTLHRWTDARTADVVVVRPDRYVLAVGSDLDAITAEVWPLLSWTAPVRGVAGSLGVASPC
jgi:3-(3-hydroxy-phenyl)propionate hydroxylase